MRNAIEQMKSYTEAARNIYGRTKITSGDARAGKDRGIYRGGFERSKFTTKQERFYKRFNSNNTAAGDIPGLTTPAARGGGGPRGGGGGGRYGLLSSPITDISPSRMLGNAIRRFGNQASRYTANAQNDFSRSAAATSKQYNLFLRPAINRFVIKPLKEREAKEKKLKQLKIKRQVNTLRRISKRNVKAENDKLKAEKKAQSDAARAQAKAQADAAKAQAKAQTGATTGTESRGGARKVLKTYTKEAIQSTKGGISVQQAWNTVRRGSSPEAKVAITNKSEVKQGKVDYRTGLMTGSQNIPEAGQQKRRASRAELERTKGSGVVFPKAPPKNKYKQPVKEVSSESLPNVKGAKKVEKPKESQPLSPGKIGKDSVAEERKGRLSNILSPGVKTTTTAAPTAKKSREQVVSERFERIKGKNLKDSKVVTIGDLGPIDGEGRKSFAKILRNTELPYRRKARAQKSSVPETPKPTVEQAAPKRASLLGRASEINRNQAPTQPTTPTRTGKSMLERGRAINTPEPISKIRPVRMRTPEQEANIKSRFQNRRVKATSTEPQSPPRPAPAPIPKRTPEENRKFISRNILNSRAKAYDKKFEKKNIIRQPRTEQDLDKIQTYLVNRDLRKFRSTPQELRNRNIEKNKAEIRRKFSEFQMSRLPTSQVAKMKPSEIRQDLKNRRVETLKNLGNIQKGAGKTKGYSDALRSTQTSNTAAVRRAILNSTKKTGVSTATSKVNSGLSTQSKTIQKQRAQELRQQAAATTTSTSARKAALRSTVTGAAGGAGSAPASKKVTTTSRKKSKAVTKTGAKRSYAGEGQGSSRYFYKNKVKYERATGRTVMRQSKPGRPKGFKPVKGAGRRSLRR
jgi:hypothetical protein